MRGWWLMGKSWFKLMGNKRTNWCLKKCTPRPFSYLLWREVQIFLWTWLSAWMKTVEKLFDHFALVNFPPFIGGKGRENIKTMWEKAVYLKKREKREEKAKKNELKRGPRNPSFFFLFLFSLCSSLLFFFLLAVSFAWSVLCSWRYLVITNGRSLFLLRIYEESFIFLLTIWFDSHDMGKWIFFLR